MDFPSNYQKMIVNVALEKLYVYKAKDQPGLFYYYATVFNTGTTLKLQGVATPLLIQALVGHLEKGAAFECTIEQAGNTFQLVQLLEPAYKSKIDEFFPKSASTITAGERMTFEPKQIILRKRAAGLFVIIKSEDGVEKYGTVDNDWVFWYLAAMRHSRTIEIVANDEEFVNYGFDPENNVGPNQLGYGESHDYLERLGDEPRLSFQNFYFAKP